MRAPRTARNVTGTRGGAALDQRGAAVAPFERAVLQERPDRLADEQRVARGSLVDAADAFGLDRGTGDVRREPGRLGFGEALELDALDISASGPGRDPTRPRAGKDDQRTVGRRVDDQLHQVDARWIEPVQVVDDDDPRSGDGQEPVDVSRGDVDERRRDLGRVGRHVGRFRLPAGERRVPGHRRDRPAEPARLLGREIVREQQPARERARVDTMLVGDGLGEEAGEPIRLALGVRDVLGPGPGEAGRSTGLFGGRQQA